MSLQISPRLKPLLKLILLAILAGGFAATAAVLYLVFSGPRMRVQPSVRSFEQAMPLPPQGSVPVGSAQGQDEDLPSDGLADQLASPIPASPDILAAGKVYYGYYCAFCHGRSGMGDGPVGDSYVPKPKGLGTDRVRAMSDGRLLLAMLGGAGHAPVLPGVVPPAHRWPLVLYVKSLASGTGGK